MLVTGVAAAGTKGAAVGTGDVIVEGLPGQR